MKIGIINKRNKFVLDGVRRERYFFYNFAITNNELSILKIFNSAFSTPARYIWEIYRRLSLMSNPNSDDSFFIFNPLYEIYPNHINIILSEIDKIYGSDHAIVFSDRIGRPIGYYFPKSFMPSEERYLTLLSTVDSRKDKELLSMFFLCPTEDIAIISISLYASKHNDFYYDADYHNVLKWTTDSAIETLSKRLGIASNDIGGIAPQKKNEIRRLRDSIPFAAIMPYHAGDVLFFGIAKKYIDTHITRVVVGRIYVDILIDMSSDLTPIPLDSQPPSRYAKNITETEYFYEIVNKISQDSFYYYCRTLRKYSLSKFYLIDQFAFALGASFVSEGELISKSKPQPKQYKPPSDIGPFRILLHFGGGWPLKVYPVELQNRLINLLSERGYHLTILSDSGMKRDEFNCVKFENVYQLRNLLESSHILIGMDSFPCHFAANILGLPAICLFANTRPVHADAQLSRTHIFLENELKCSPCAGVDRCPLNNKRECENFVSPEKVFSSVMEMLHTLYPNK